MNMKWHKRLYKLGFYNIGYDTKYLAPGWRLLEPFAQIADGVLGLILFFTPVVPNFTEKVLRKMIQQQMRKRIERFDQQNTPI